MPACEEGAEAQAPRGSLDGSESNLEQETQAALMAKARERQRAKAEILLAKEAHQTLKAAVPGIIAPPVSARRAAADPVYAALKGIATADSGSESEDEMGV